ncbi:cellulose synthase-like protein G1 [Diospyros lotus]|uniref:cellulose synthase-like protein G1 n=1 Tax=Diospyros lotus TaxID=55363 RepID=UPI0022558176|nr:cellulose synthase-like protein G1 [Diospyros lotus]
MADTVALHTCKTQPTRVIVNRVHNLVHLTAKLAQFYYRFSRLFLGGVPILPWLLITVSEALFAFLWVLAAAFEWRPVARTAHPENIPAQTELPAVDVFIVTADPKREPVLEVMNTVVSAMALDYPAEKLAVYLSDDGGSSLTLFAIREAGSFAKCWLPFCRKYGIKTRCPEAYFSPSGDRDRLWTDEFKADEEVIKAKYRSFKQKVEKANGSDGIDDEVVHDRPALVEIIHDRKDGMDNDEQAKIPLLVYVSREKRPSHPHRFKAGALNALLRVSGIMSNGPYVLVLDCDMYCNDPSSARQAMCFHLDPSVSPSLAFVQYPQMFHNLSKNDIYDNQSRSTYMLRWQGMDGLRGPVFSGTGYYMKRKAMYGTPNNEDAFLDDPERNFGLSSKFIDSFKGKNEPTSNSIVHEARNLASCNFEKGTEWGKEIGYSYVSLLESSFTGYLLHCRGWRSVYLYPKRPCFLGCAPVDMKDTSVQLMKWTSSMIQIGLSRFSPLTYGVSRMSVLQSMCYGFLTLFPLLSVAHSLYGTVPQLCLLSGVPLFPKAYDPWFAVFAISYMSSTSQHLFEVFSTNGSVRTWWNEERIGMIRSLSAFLIGFLDAAMKWLGMTKTKFRLSNKALEKEKVENYEKGKFDFEGADMFMAPLATIALMNLVCFIGGLARVALERSLDELLAQLLICSMILAINYPILAGIVQRKSKS